jgi:signal transduction histidine kinase
MNAPSLSRQLVRTMTGLAVLTTLFVVIGSYGFYYLVAKYVPETQPDNTADWAFTTHEAVWLAFTLLLAVAASVVLANRLAQRILVPLNSVAESLKQLTRGDLAARAQGGDPALGEVTQLVNDFNAMASQLERVTQEQAQWSAAIAHELRTPVTILRGRLQGLADGVFTPSQPLFLKLLSQVEGLTRLIEDLRVLGLSGSGHLHLQMIEADLAAEVRKVVEVFEPVLQASGHRVELQLGAGKACCDPVRIRQVLLALLENASKYAVPGTVRVRLGVDAQTCSLRVEDDGPGVPPATAQRMFDAFWRAEASRSRHSGGSGLGLAVVAAIARAHGGQAVCTPSDHGGAAIEIAWPNRPVDSAAQQHDEAPMG